MDLVTREELEAFEDRLVSRLKDALGVGLDSARLLKVDAVASMLGLSRSKVYALVAAGTLPTVRIDGSLRVPAARLREYVESLEAEPVS